MSAIQRRRLGRTGIEVAELGLGAMDTPTSDEGEETLSLALDLGVDFIDSAREYEGSEFLLGQVIRARGGKDFTVGTKTFSHTRDGAQREVDKSLSMLGVDRIDLYQLHDISTPGAWDEVMGEGGALEGLQIAKYRGLIGHIGVSSHSLEMLERAINCDELDAVMLEYSAFFPETRRLIALANERDVGVIVMRPLGGSGRMSSVRGGAASGSEGVLTPAKLLTYVLSDPGISVAIPGARYPSRIRDNVATATSYQPLVDVDQRRLEAEARRLY